jgi:hypothetical protein
LQPALITSRRSSGVIGAGVAAAAIGVGAASAAVIGDLAAVAAISGGAASADISDLAAADSAGIELAGVDGDDGPAAGSGRPVGLFARAEMIVRAGVTIAFALTTSLFSSHWRAAH